MDNFTPSLVPLHTLLVWLNVRGKILPPLIFLILLWGFPDSSFAVNIHGNINTVNQAQSGARTQFTLTGIHMPRHEFDIEGWRRYLEGEWRNGDDQSPPFGTTEKDGPYSLEIPKAFLNYPSYSWDLEARQQYFSRAHLPEGNRQAEPTPDESTREYDVIIGMGYLLNKKTIPLLTSLGEDTSIENDFTIDLSRYFIDQWGHGFNAGKVKQEFESQTGIDASPWIPWEPGFGNSYYVITDWPVDLPTRNTLNWGLGKEDWLGGEADPETEIAPAPGLHSYTWPLTEADPMPKLFFHKVK